MHVEDNNNISKIINELNYLDSHELRVGVLGDDDSFMVMIARVHEFGVTIYPKKAQSLAIPLKKEVRYVSPKEVKGIFRPKGTNILAIKKGKNDIEPLYVLLRSVKIPERAFLRTAFDENKDKIIKYVEQLLIKVFNCEISGQVLYDRLGLYCVSLVRKKIIDLKEPPKSSLTLELEGEGKNNPLIESGRLRDSISYEVVER